MRKRGRPARIQIPDGLWERFVGWYDSRPAERAEFEFQSYLRPRRHLERYGLADRLLSGRLGDSEATLRIIRNSKEISLELVKPLDDFLRSIPSQLPFPTPDFLGRSYEIELALGVVPAGGRGISIQGMGGCGKSELALVIADRLRTRYPDGHLFVDLRGVAHREPVPVTEVMRDWIHAFEPYSPMVEGVDHLTSRYRSVLGGKRVLVILDNAADVEEIKALEPPSTCLTIVTSRYQLSIPGFLTIHLGELSDDDSKALVERICPRATGEAAAKISELCGCLPLALETASRTLAERRDLPVEQYIENLSTPGRRRQLVEEVLRLSFDLLSEPLLRSRWCALSVFPGDFDREGVAAVWECSIEAANHSLSELVRANLLRWNEARSRHSLHDLARVVASGLMEPVMLGDAQLRHAQYYCDALEEMNAAYLLGGEAAESALKRFDLETGNSSAGETWALAQAEGPGRRLAATYPIAGSAIKKYRFKASSIIESCEVGLSAALELGLTREARFNHNSLGLAHLARGEYEVALQYFTSSLHLDREIGDKELEGFTLGNMGNVYRGLGDYEKALDHHKQHLRIAQELGNRRDQSTALGNVGLCMHNVGDFEESLEIQLQALVIARETDFRESEGRALENIGICHFSLCEYDSALKYFELSFECDRELVDREGEAITLNNIAETLGALNRVPEALEKIESACTIFRNMESRYLAEAEAVRDDLMLRVSPS